MTRLIKLVGNHSKSTMSTSLCLTLVVLSALLLVSQASPIDKPGPLSERILFAQEGTRAVRLMQGPGHRKHTVVSPSGAEVVHAFEGQDVVLECEAASRSGPSIHWLHNGRRISQVSDGVMEDYEELSEDESMSTGSTRSRLFLDCVSARDAGEYICVADTPTSRNISVRTLIVDEAPLEIKERRMIANSRSGKRAFKGKSSSCDKKSTENDAARIYEWSTRRLVVEDNDIRLLCRASGTPQPKIVWLDRNDKPISDLDDQYQILSNGDLVIRKTTFKQNMGAYQCVANNGHGVDTVSTFVYPAGKETGRPAARFSPMDLNH